MVGQRLSVFLKPVISLDDDHKPYLCLALRWDVQYGAVKGSLPPEFSRDCILSRVRAVPNCLVRLSYQVEGGTLEALIRSRDDITVTAKVSLSLFSEMERAFSYRSVVVLTVLDGDAPRLDLCSVEVSQVTLSRLLQ